MLSAGAKVVLQGGDETTATVRSLPLLPGAAAGIESSIPRASLREIPSNINWLPLESNPEVLNSFATRVGGLNDGWHFVDVFGLDDDLLAFVPQPCKALILLHPSGSRVPAFRERRRALVSQSARDEPTGKEPSGKHAFYMTQHDEAGNACGTIATIHAIINARVPLRDGSVLASFVESNAAAAPSLIGWRLLETQGMYEASDESAHSGETATPSRGADVDFHFIALVNRDGRLLDLDGRKPRPLDCGATSDQTFLNDAAKVVREQYINLAPDDPGFNVMALVREV